VTRNTPTGERARPAAPTMLVLVASGVAELRKRWRHSIEERFVVHEVTERTSLERTLANRRVAALLLDLELPELGGIAGVAPLQRLRPAAKTVLLTTHPDEREGIAGLKAGARGYCDREIDPQLLCKALEVVQRGEIWVGRKLIPHLLEELTALTEQQEKEAPPELDSRLERITPRERQIVQLLSAGASNKEIAKQLNVTERTVKAHLTAIFRKLGISGRLQLALFVLEHSRPGGPSDTGPKFN
jgi:two-component system, NarL family, nitrate/nitrite response regulator NarL